MIETTQLAFAPRDPRWYLNLCGGYGGDPPEPCCTVDHPCDYHLRSSVEALRDEYDRVVQLLDFVSHGGAMPKEAHRACCTVCHPPPKPSARRVDDERPF